MRDEDTMTTIEIIQSVFVSDEIGRDTQNKRADADRRAQDFAAEEYADERRLHPERRLPEILFAEIDEHIVIQPPQGARDWQ